MKRTYSTRNLVIRGIFITVGVIYVLRLFYLQVIDDSYMLSAENNVLRKITIYPARGIIYDRNGKLLVFDEAAYDLMVVPRQAKHFDTLELCKLLNISDTLFRKNFEKAKKFSMYKPSVIVPQISKEEYGFIAEKLYKYPGFFVQSRSLRKYPLPIAAHTFGYIAEVNPNDIEKDPYYKIGDYIGKSGIEKSYEPVLRGFKGSRIIMVDVFNREQGSYRDGRYDTLAVAGEDIWLSMDADLQAYGEKLMLNKIGSIVAIEPATGEILAFVSSPTYDPNLLVGRVRTKNFNLLMQDPYKPLMNRAVLGSYPPGSTFKMINALVGLQVGTLNVNTTYSCNGPSTVPIRCTHRHVSPLPLLEAIMQSCNPYFWNVYRSIINQTGNPAEGFNTWREHVYSMGFGHKFGTDIPFELNGLITTQGYYDKIYGEGHWTAMTIRSLAIGQGEILVTPLQMANFAATVANKGFYYPPHLVKAKGAADQLIPEFTKKVVTTISPEYYNIVEEGMLGVFEGAHGTARWAAIDSIRVCGKTGTAQNPHGKEHSLFIAYGPYENPKIAICVIVENAGFGSTWAAPIATLLIEKYLTGNIKRTEIEKRMLEGNLLP